MTEVQANKDICVNDEDYEKFIDIFNEYCMPLQMKNEF